MRWWPARARRETFSRNCHTSAARFAIVLDLRGRTSRMQGSWHSATPSERELWSPVKSGYQLRSVGESEMPIRVPKPSGFDQAPGLPRDPEFANTCGTPFGQAFG